MLKNYYESVKEAGAEVRDTKDTFISTFAPKPDDNGDTLALLLSILQIPINIGGARFFASCQYSFRTIERAVCLSHS